MIPVAWLFEQSYSTWDGNIYHYILEHGDVDTILKSGKLVPIDILKDPKIMKFYSDKTVAKKLCSNPKENSDLENAEICWKYYYDKFYKDILNKPYEHYGIYMTTIDLFAFPTKPKYRFRFSYDDIKDKEVTIQVSGNVKKVKSYNDLKRAADKFSNPKIVERIWNTSENFKFKRLTQVVVFADHININESMLERREDYEKEDIRKAAFY